MTRSQLGTADSDSIPVFGRFEAGQAGGFSSILMQVGTLVFPSTVGILVFPKTPSKTPQQVHM
jgi:hypothetical protein